MLGMWFGRRTVNGRIREIKSNLEDITEELGRPMVSISHRPDCPVNLPPGPHYTRRICNCDFGERFANFLNRSEGKPETGEYHSEDL